MLAENLIIHHLCHVCTFVKLNFQNNSPKCVIESLFLVNDKIILTWLWQSLHKNKLFFYHTESLENTLVSNPIVAIKTIAPEVLIASHHLSEPQVLFNPTRPWCQRPEVP